ncbi:MAG: phosphoribosylformylglycinamidine synthase subunit PurS [Actinomycetota bacterium]
MARVAIDVMLKQEILDPQGQTVEVALPTLGYPDVHKVRIGKHIELEIDESSPEEAARKVENLATRLLSNPVIEEFTYEIEL